MAYNEVVQPEGLEEKTDRKANELLALLDGFSSADIDMVLKKVRNLADLFPLTIKFPPSSLEP